MIRTIPLAKLTPSPRNVRRAVDEAADLQLKSDIEARGLLQNLVVAPAKKPRVTCTVEAGGRRLRALLSLAEEGKLDAGHEVCCLVLDGGPAAAQEASLAENFQRLAMNPADECLAFGQLIEQGADVEGIARRFGLTVRFVEGRLRLSALAPAVFEALGAGEITLDLAKAYAATPDRERQAWVFEQMRGSYAAAHPDSIRRMMTQATASASDPRARLVGEDTYVSAGGRIERDLFSDEAGVRWLDLPLLERLATERMEALAAETAAALGLAWVRPALDSWPRYALTAGLERIVPERAPLSDEEAERENAAQGEIEALASVLEDENAPDEVRQEAEEKIEALEREIAAIRARPPVLDPALKPRLGTFLLLDDSGVPRLDDVFYAEPAEGLDEADDESHCEGGLPSGQPFAASASDASGDDLPASLDERPQPLSRALVDELAIQRRDVLAVHVAADPSLALDLAIFLMIDRDASYSSERSGSSLIAVPPSDPVFGFKTPEAAATMARERAADALDRSWTGGASRIERFDAFRALPDAARSAWLGHAVARTLEASANVGGERMCAFHDHLGRLLEIDVAQWWRPTGSSFFDRVPKSVTLAALEEIGGAAFASGYSGLKKAELAQSAERIFAGDAAADDVKVRALAWVPEPMRFAPAPAAVAEAEVEVVAEAEDQAQCEVEAEGYDDIPPWEELPSSGGSKHQLDPEREGSAAGSCGEELPERFEQAA